MTDYVASPRHGSAWITGASSGIGRALALRLARAGWSVAVTARSADALQALADEAESFSGMIVPFPGDVTDAAAMAETARRIEGEAGPVALLVANAGVYLPQGGLAPDIAAFSTSIDVNLKGTVHVLAPVIEAMKARGRGQIAVVASVAGYRGLPTSAAYGATKAGLINMAEALKFDLDRAGIRIQVVSPGFVDTPATRDNPFPMPHLMDAQAAAERIVAGLTRPTGFEIAFPRRFALQLKLLRLLPYRLYFPLVARVTGWTGKGPATQAGP
ncbi:SDR family NAD(P)-dependent oxidoreductase [Polymorphum gilvum]|uniref:Probable oxidoreductase protein n=1 Tax=Polymorphum gilvum (strain LMG 25793 / CGMCC 1.9160 / SL003B-26A1) TaxID=991905 RepID=F2IXC4_POLGS|nr:SDR family NAD(P)-dependent oxidoreductase [Polymorphum gilvum]ADZ70442.1 Probable oxidoreductase protein [Polymorphum gilvum SL003B-26A1]